MRLDKFLANSGVGSRKEVKQIIKKRQGLCEWQVSEKSATHSS